MQNYLESTLKGWTAINYNASYHYATRIYIEIITFSHILKKENGMRAKQLDHKFSNRALSINRVLPILTAMAASTLPLSIFKSSSDRASTNAQ